ncbi:unnamed protein product [Cuscuta campestris]|uniref:GAG-pre-integrase domain-containing protein n=1 Tax=Cuscuta campestris TaxID=132261 RepID=A0A484NQ37_9ASTE|nr:unnamed protein product [Cuscuta campestris]
MLCFGYQLLDVSYLSEPNYKKWSRLFLLLVRRFNLEGFLTGEKTSTGKDDVEWLQLDALIQGWILSTVNDEVSDLIISSTTSAADLWKSIHNLFHVNKAARAMQLEQQFFNTVKGTSIIATYCQTLRNIADWLDDVDAPVSENQLVLQTLRGLPEDLSNQASFLQFQKPPPTFMETRSALLLLEGQRRPAAGEGSTALAAHGGGGPRGPGFGGHGGQHLGLSSGSNGPPQAYGGRGQSHGGRGGRPTRGRGQGRNGGTPSRHFPGQDPRTGNVIHRSNDNGPLYPLRPHVPVAQAHVASVDTQTWHRRLGHPSPAVFHAIPPLSVLHNKHFYDKLCHACQLGKHVRLPFTSSSRTSTFSISTYAY